MKAPTKIENISEWLDIATRDLTPSAKQRITQEIQSHYADALQAHLDENENFSEASLAALNELGNPSLAAKVYRKKYLTLKEDEKIRNLVARSAGVNTNSIVIWISLTANWLLWNSVHRGINIASMLLTLVGGMLAFGLVPFLARTFVNKFQARNAADRILLLEPMRAIGFTLFPSLGLEMIPWFWWIIVACLTMTLSLSYWLPIRSRFLKTAN